MKSKYFTVEVKPLLPASIQTAAYAAGEILFDWTAIQIPRGVAKLISLTVLVRGTNGADQQGIDMELFFAKTVDSVAPVTLGTTGAAVDTPGWQNHLIGYTHMDASANAISSLDDLVFMSMMQMPSRGGAPGILLAGEPNSGDTVGHDTIYIAGLAQGAYDFRSTVQVSTETAINTTAVVVKTTSALINFAAGDVLHDENDLVIGTIKTVTDAENLVLEADCGAVSAVNKDLYNINPFTFILGFEK